MPYKIPACAGKPYQPSNGTEGLMFFERFCDRCKKNDYDNDTGTGGCIIQMNTMIYNIDDHGYPREWTHTVSGEPTCTAFEKRED